MRLDRVISSGHLRCILMTLSFHREGPGSAARSSRMPGYVMEVFSYGRFLI